MNRRAVTEYWDRYTLEYLEHMTTFQAGLLTNEHDQDRFRDSNLRYAQRIGIRSNWRILDAGAGVCGPSIDFAAEYKNLEVFSITLSGVQARVADRRIQTAGLSNRVKVLAGDYHQLPFPSGYFDAVVFLESFGYSNDKEALLGEVRRVLKPQGILYLKEVFRREKANPEQAAELQQFTDLYVYNPPTSKALEESVRQSGFEINRVQDISNQIDKTHVRASMVRDSHGNQELSSFGTSHYRGFTCLPIWFGELHATNPATNTHGPETRSLRPNLQLHGAP